MYPNCSNLSYNEIFARNVKARRKAMNLTRKELAEERMGYPEELLARVEAGDATGCTIDFLVCLSEYLEVSIETLMTNRYFCPYYVNRTEQNGAPKEPTYRLYIVSSGRVAGEGAYAYRSAEVIATSEDAAISMAIERDKKDGLYRENIRYFVRPRASVLDKKEE